MDVFGSGKGRVDNTDESIQEILQAATAYMPGLMEKIREQYAPQARAEVDIAKTYSPELNKLSTDLLDTSGRELLRSAGNCRPRSNLAPRRLRLIF